jgi:predicted transcriptional regulator
MARVQAMVQLTDDLVGALDAEASRRGLSRSAVIREAVEEHLAADREAAIGRAIIDGYRRIPPGTPDEWGDLEGMADTAGRETAQRLDGEERAAGFDRW